VTVEYCASADFLGEPDPLTAPPEAPNKAYRLTVIPA
jgi:hypothetical protein